MTYLWDEHVSHWIWYVGLILILASVARSVLRADVQALGVRAAGVLLSALVGLTLFNNWVEGQTPWLGLAAAAAGVVVGRRTDRGAGRVYLLTVAGVALVLLVGWGAYWAVVDGLLFPQFSELGWI